MKKVIFGFIVVAVLAVALVAAGVAYAQSGTPGSGFGMGYGRGMMGRGSNAQNGQYGILHDGMITYFAQKLGLTVDEINTRLANGETMYQIAVSKGYTADQFTTLMTEARSQAIDQAVKAGTITQAQGDFMRTRGGGMMGSGGRGTGMGAGRGMMGRGNYAGGYGQGTGNPGCPYYNQTNP